MAEEKKGLFEGLFKKDEPGHVENVKQTQIIKDGEVITVKEINGQIVILKGNAS